MKTDKHYKYFLYVFVIIISLSIIIIKLNKNHGYFYRNYSRLHGVLSEFLARELVIEKPLPAIVSKQVSRNNTFIYILGGGQGSLTHRFQVASTLYHRGLSSKILILSRPGITEYDPDLRRNLTNDEWARKEFGKLNVKKEDIEPVSIHASFFGTLREAEDLLDIVRGKECNRLILITSAYHTRRTFAAFSRFASKSSLELYIYGSDDTPGLRGLIWEYMKLVLYKGIILHIYDGKEKVPKE